MRISPKLPAQTTAAGTGFLTSLAVVCLCSFLAPPVLAAPGEGCANEAVRAESNIDSTTGQPYSQGLPECRAYEMVSPLEKQQHDAIQMNVAYAPVVSPSGEAIGWQSQGDFLDPENYQVQGFSPSNPYISVREAMGWTTRSAFPPASLIEDPTDPNSYLLPQDEILSADLAEEAGCGLGTLLSAYGSNILCAKREADGQWGGTPYNSLGDELTNRPYLDGASGDLTTAIVQTNDPGVHFLPADDTPVNCGIEGGENCHALYEVGGVGTSSPRLRLVDVDNNGNLIGPEHAVAVGSIAGSTYQAVSQDGQTIFFTATPPGGVPTIYARLGGEETVPVSEPSSVQCTETCAEAARQEAVYDGATQDGSKVFFTTAEPLVNTDTDETSDLYEYDFARPPAERLTQISAGGQGDLSRGSGAEVLGVVGISEDGSHVYFIARGVLTSLPNALGQSASSGARNLYGYATDTGETKFVATLAPQDSPELGLGSQAAQVTPDGQYLVFDTYAHLDLDDLNSGQAVYRYDFETGQLMWVSHDAAGTATPDEGLDSTVALKPFTGGGGALPTVNDANRAITEDGSYIVFSSSEKLQTSAIDGAPNVYLWHNGAVSMISDGRDPEGATDAVISASGADVFFETRERLVAQDIDALGDIYDARIDGGFPAPTKEASCSGESCQGTVPAAPGLAGNETSTFSAGGNLPPASTAFPSPTGVKPKPATKAQQLMRALELCHKDKSRKKRASCERTAHKKYSPSKKRTKEKG
jgi:WD40-like Beta Propeller Repeat